MSSSCSLNHHHHHQVPHSHNPIQQQQQQHSVRSSNYHHHHRFKRLCLLALNSNSTNTTTTTTTTPTTSFDPGSTIYTSSVLQSPPSRHVIALNFIACATAVSATWLFLSAIPMLLAFKRAAESLEKLLDVTREELPDTMAAVRLSGMEISDLTMELSDLGQEITQGVKSSTCAVRLAEERLRSLTNMNPPASMQVVVQMKPEQAGPVVARRARTIRENIVKSRAFMQMFFSITQFSKVAFKYLRSRSKSKA